MREEGRWRGREEGTEGAGKVQREGGRYRGRQGRYRGEKDSKEGGR